MGNPVEKLNVCGRQNKLTVQEFIDVRGREENIVATVQVISILISCFVF